jgi:hypothetical protein
MGPAKELPVAIIYSHSRGESPLVRLTRCGELGQKQPIQKLSLQENIGSGLSV